MEWISVEDRLPENETQCIGYFNHKWQVDFRVNEVWFTNNRWYWDLDLIENITHWMPLPEPPKQ